MSRESRDARFVVSGRPSCQPKEDGSQEGKRREAWGWWRSIRECRRVFVVSPVHGLRGGAKAPKRTTREGWHVRLGRSALPHYSHSEIRINSPTIQRGSWIINHRRENPLEPL